MKKYLVKVRSTQQGGLQPVLLFDPLAEIEFAESSYKEGVDIEQYEILTRFDLDRILDLSSEVVEYTSEEV
jgi:hypothetical protein